ncbi:hypothetical protein Glove_131g40 [Diversispora epigaea]|uniref:Crinkler effector protein N-terminal domain-containing protein n=1 Tax=Diversispora epigaea TaxID=1348612 RepID=A0A397J7T6_9GLOM|nr:hypothetical protein Glove_131g40 [Diversispora epigaea]
MPCVTEVMIFCLVLGDAVENAFVVDIKENKTISHLKDVIKEKTGLNIPANKLRLWKVDIPQSKENQKNIISVEVNIKEELAGEELAPFEIINNYFDKSSIHIQIIVQLPTTTGQGHFNMQSCNLDYLPRQDGRGGTLLSYNLTTGYSIEDVSLTDPDISMRSEIILSLIKDLMQKKIIFIRSPPYSGKTSLAQLLENYLVQSQDFSEYRVIRISMLWASVVKMKCNWNTFGTVWKNIIGVSWLEWIGQCKSIPSILIMDEVQMIYMDDYEIVRSMNTKTALGFWNTIKANLQELSNIYIIMFGTYGYGVNSTGLSTPVTIPPDNCKSFFDIKFTDDELWNYVKNFCNRHFVLLDNNTFNDIISKFNRYIQKATAGHVGLVRHILHNTKSAMKWRIHENVLTWKDIFVYLNSNKFNLTIDECRVSPKIKSFSTEQLEICESVYLNGKFIFRPSDKSTQQLVKSGVLVANDEELYFSAPLIMRSFFQQCYGSFNNIKIIPSSLYYFIVKTFTTICNGQSRKILRKMLEFETDRYLLEQTWQKEFYKVATQVLGKAYFISCNIEAVFECDGYIDFYIDKLEWAIELLRDDKGMAEYSRRFEPVGEYKEIVRYAKSIAIIDICNESKKVRKLQKDFVYVSCSENYNTFKIECLGKESLTINIRD